MTDLDSIVQIPVVIPDGPNAGQVMTQLFIKPFAGAKYMSSGSDGTVIWSDSKTGRLRYYSPNGQEIVQGPAGQVTVPAPKPPTTATPPTTAPVAANPNPSKSLGITAAQYDAFQKFTEDTLVNLGVAIRDGAGNLTGIKPTDDDIVRFATMGPNGATPDQVDAYYRGRQDVLEAAPWVAFNTTREGYESATAGYKAASNNIFGREDALGGTPNQGSLQDRQSTLQGYAMKERISPEEFAQDIGRFRQERGRAPTDSTEYATYRATPRIRQSQAQITPYYDFSSGKPTLPKPQSQKSPRPAIR